MLADTAQLKATKEGGGGAVGGDLAQATFNVGSAVINVQSTVEATTTDSDIKSDSLEGKGEVRGESIDDIKTARSERTEMKERRNQLKS